MQEYSLVSWLILTRSVVQLKLCLELSMCRQQPSNKCNLQVNEYG